jgi:hypothetical protein
LIISAAKDTTEKGSSTLVIVTIDPKINQIYTAYIGDSGYLLLR